MNNKNFRWDFFINYRRDSSTETAQVLKAKLEDRQFSVFLDLRSMKVGQYEEQIFNAIDSSRSFLTILSANSLDRCVNVDDLFRREIAHAISAGCDIVPVMKDGFNMPESRELPEDINVLPKQQHVVYYENDPDYVVDQVLDKLSASQRLRKRHRNYSNENRNRHEEIDDIKAVIPRKNVARIKREIQEYEQSIETPMGSVGFLERVWVDRLGEWRQSANSGNPEALLLVGRCMQEGIGMQKNKCEAVHLISLAAEQGLAIAQFDLAKCYIAGDGVAQDEAEGVRWYRKAATQRVAAALCNLGWCCHYGKGVLKDQVESVKLYREAVELGSVTALKLLGWCYAYGEGVAKGRKEARKWYRKAIALGDVQAMNLLNRLDAWKQGIRAGLIAGGVVLSVGICLFNWWITVLCGLTIGLLALRIAVVSADNIPVTGVVSNIGLTGGVLTGIITRHFCAVWFEWWPWSLLGGVFGFFLGLCFLGVFAQYLFRHKAAEQGDANCQYALGEANNKSSKDQRVAVVWYRKAAGQGHAKAQYKLGRCFEKGAGTSKNLTEAVRWYREAAEQGNAYAQYYLGWCYMNGDGISKDKAEGFRWCNKAAEQGLVEALFRVGFWCLEGQGVSKDASKGMEQLRKADKKGHVLAQLKLGMCYFQGEGVIMDLKEATKWFRKAAAQGNEDAKGLLLQCVELRKITR